jgi:CelD/BcsL family acetyltransferase involved in cellulose biosynthesis
MITVNKISTVSDFIKLEPIWNQLAEDSSSTTPFHSFDWFRCCIENFLGKKELSVLVFRNHAGVIGIAPLWCYPDQFRALKTRNIGFISSPETPFSDFIVKDGHHLQVVRETFSFLFRTENKGWDLINLSPLGENSDTVKCLSKLTQMMHLKVYFGHPTVIPYLPVDKSWPEKLEEKSPRFKKTHRNIVNRIGKLRNVETVCIRNDSNGSLIDEIVDLSKRSWKNEEGISIANDRRTIAFFRALTEVASKSGFLFSWLLKVDGIPVAMEYDLEQKGKIYALRADYDESFKKYSPGTYLEYTIIKYLFENEFSEYNTGPGLRDYKLNWANHLKNYKNVYICNNNGKAILIWLLKRYLYPIFKTRSMT